MQTKTTQNRSGKPTVLVLEDNADQWFMIRWALFQRFPEVEPIWIVDPAQAILYLEACLQDGELMPRLILLDYYLPHWEEGRKTLTLLKAHPIYREIPVIVLSQSGSREDIENAYKAGCNSYIVKPKNCEEWLLSVLLIREYWWKTATLPEMQSSE